MPTIHCERSGLHYKWVSGADLTTTYVQRVTTYWFSVKLFLSGRPDYFMTKTILLRSAKLFTAFYYPFLVEGELNSVFVTSCHYDRILLVWCSPGLSLLRPGLHQSGAGLLITGLQIAFSREKWELLRLLWISSRLKQWGGRCYFQFIQK